MNRKKLNLVTIISDSVAELAPVAYEKQIDIEFISSESNVTILGNTTALAILLRNLIDNAIRYTPQHGHMYVKLTRDSRYAILQVIDNGPGIPAELRTRVFERFYRMLGNNSTGSGLGLAIVSQIVGLHHGNITLDAAHADGTGLAVTVTFPIHNK